jgi:hypothetical protein
MRNKNQHTELEWASFPLLSHALRQARLTKKPHYFDLQEAAMAMLRGPSVQDWVEVSTAAVKLFDQILANPASSEEAQLISDVRNAARSCTKAPPLRFEAYQSKACHRAAGTLGPVRVRTEMEDQVPVP